MEITANSWNAYLEKMAAISSKGALLISAWIDKNGLNDRQALITYAYLVAQKYGEAITELACEMYDAIAELENVTVPPASPEYPPSYQDIAIAVIGALNMSPSYVPNAIDRALKQVGADTMLYNAGRDGAYFAWIPHGAELCPFCLGIAGEGWKKASKNVAKGNHAEHIHSNCKCQFAIDFKGGLDVGGYDPKQIRDRIRNDLGIDVNNFNLTQDEINKLRREAYARNADEINAQHREAYAERNEIKEA